MRELSALYAALNFIINDKEYLQKLDEAIRKEHDLSPNYALVTDIIWSIGKVAESHNPDYHKRVINEQRNLSEMCASLEAAVMYPKDRKLDPLLRAQLKAMQTYNAILQIRIKEFSNGSNQCTKIS